MGVPGPSLIINPHRLMRLGITSTQQHQSPASGVGWSLFVKRSRDDVADHAEPDEIITLNELAQYLKVHVSTIYKLLKENKIPAFRVGSDWRFSRREIDRWMLTQQK
jgi:excisionase family DNA binding protein